MGLLLATSVFAGIPQAKSESSEKAAYNTEWETIYQMKDTPKDNTPLPDMSVYRIQKRLIWPPYYRVRYWIYCTDEFIGTFKDEVYLSDDPNIPEKWYIDDYSHDNEDMWKGINGAYKTRIFPSHGGWGYYWITVKLDVEDTVDEGYVGFDWYDNWYDGNNAEKVKTWFWW